MDWLDWLNESITYVEKHLTQELDVKAVAQVAGCSTYHYQRMFSYISGMTFGEYVRRRKMSLAGTDLQSGEKVVDVAIKYGYASPTAFNRVFKSIHGMTPQEAKKAGATLTSYPMLTFAIKIQGVEAMEYQLIEKEAFTVVGFGLKLDKDMEKSQQRIPNFWNEVAMSGGLEKLVPLIEGEVPGILGLSMMTADSQEEWEYVIGVVSEQASELAHYHIPAAKWAVFTGQGKMPEAIQELQQRIFTEWLPTSGFEYAELPDIEVYLDNNPEQAQFQVWLPVRNK